MEKGNGVSIILAVLNEEDNVQLILNSISDLINTHNLTQLNEVVFVDDGSNDDTISIIEKNKDINHPFIIKLVKRTVKMGLVDAHIVGARSASNERIIIMDADLQHPVSCIPKLIKESENGYNLIIASRYIRGGQNNWTPMRGLISRVAVSISHFFITSSRKVKDPISGYFLTTKRIISTLYPYNNSYKLLLYILSFYRDIQIVEIPFKMRDREKGTSKIVNKGLGFTIQFMVEIIRYYKNTQKLGISSKYNDLSNNQSY